MVVLLPWAQRLERALAALWADLLVLGDRLQDLSHPLIQMSPKTSRKRRCSQSIWSNFAMSGSARSCFMLGSAAKWDNALASGAYRLGRDVHRLRGVLALVTLRQAQNLGALGRRQREVVGQLHDDL
jgi:hypothetical protein